MLLGAIDVGTNSIHLIVVELDPRFGTARTVLKAREMVRLGGGEALARGHLSKKAVQRGVAAIAKFADAARAAGASDVRAVATSAVREAGNREEFLAAVRATSGVAVEVLTETEEARLIHLGVSRGYPIGDRVACIFDIGGGSTEFIVADGDRPFFLHSVRLGSLRLFDEYLRDGESPLRYAALEAHVAQVLERFAKQLSEYRFDLLIGTSGTVMGLAALDAATSGVPAQRAHGYVLRLERLRELQEVMRRLGPAERRKMPGMNPRRSDIIVAGNAIVIAILEALGRDELIVSERALREGVVVDYIERNLAVARRLGDERTRRFDAAHELARRFGHDGAHESHVAGLALQLFDRLGEVHHFEPAERDVLFAAALLHDVGRAVSASAHHKHGAYIVSNAGLTGWRAEEVELIAALVRYHRKSLPKPTHAEWVAATPALREKIAGLGGILRLADGLDQRRLGVVTSLNVETEPGSVRVRLEASQDVTPEIEAALFKSDLFERAFGLRVTIEAVPRATGYDAGFGESEPSADEIEAARLSG
ncbi:MAG TPA: Ppx/GppA phosphatase family protein [Candidatus Baltobacteraceae bacterium]|nr:Ppx/GppA phosphatase family protein [Candidatus Baltobacteraceae bacterium]